MQQEENVRRMAESVRRRPGLAAASRGGSPQKVRQANKFENMKNMDAQLASNSPQKRDSGGSEANKYLIFPVLDAAGFQNWRTNYSFFSVLFADLTSAGF